MQRTIKFALAAAILSVQVSAIAVEQSGGPGQGGNGGGRQKLSCEEMTVKIIDKLATECDGDSVCDGIVSELKTKLDSGCDEAG